MKTFVKIAAIGPSWGWRHVPPARMQQVQDPMRAGGAGGVGANALPGTPEYFKASVGDTVLFAVDQSTLSPEARRRWPTRPAG